MAVKKLKVMSDKTGALYTHMTEGCKLCEKGAKMVLFVTGVCGRGCFYCPVSEERKENDVTYANEHRVGSDEDVLAEARRMKALGTGVTGGEPLARLDRTIHYISLLKKEFGPGHHIHLYTCQAPSLETLKRLRDAGLDEIRFHPSPEQWHEFQRSKHFESLKAAKSLGMDAGVEIPAIEPVPEIEKALKEVDGFLNLNELEFSDTNNGLMKQKGYSLRDDVSNAVEGSEKLARNIVKRSTIRIRYCPSRFKDAVQLRERLKRTAKNVARKFDEVSDDGTIIYGEIVGNITALPAMLEELGVPRDMFEYDEKKGMIHIAWWILDRVRGQLDGGVKMSIVERYPLEDGLVVERIPL